jgi:peptide/nickel transport system substrate-binding protein
MLDGNLNTVPILAANWSTEDNITHIFEIKPDIAMSDGSTLTADDVAYSLRQARATGRFVNRLRIISSVSVIDELTISVLLNTPNSRLPSLLDVPIIKEGTIDMRVPPGSGPYRYTDHMRLDRFIDHRYFMDLPIAYIHLAEGEDNRLTEMFDDGVISLIQDDPGSIIDIRINRFHEPRFYDTTALMFLGFSTRLPALRNADVRAAIGHAVERDYIVNEIMPGQSLAAPLALSPAYRLYDTSWEIVLNPLHEMSALLVRAGLEDFDHDSFLEYPVGGEFQSFTIDFIVNGGNASKVRIAQRIAETLRRDGIDTVVRELPWSNFLEALNTGDFDMFLGETLLSPDFDFSPLLLPTGSLNFGGTGHDDFRPLIANFLSASTDEQEAAAARVLVDQIRVNAPFVPIMYKRHAIYTPSGAISDATPSQSSVFFGFVNWNIDRNMLN